MVFRIVGIVWEVAAHITALNAVGIEVLQERLSLLTAVMFDMKQEEYSGYKAPGSSWAKLFCHTVKELDSEDSHIAVARKD